MVALFRPILAAQSARAERAQKRALCLAAADQSAAIVGQIEKQDCLICFEHIDGSKKPYLCPGPVKHAFHARCMKNRHMKSWMKNNHKCPVCTTPWSLFDEKLQLFDAVCLGDATQAIALIQDPITDINKKNMYGHTALMLAARRGYTSVVEALLARQDCAVNQRDDFGRTALIKAADSGHIETIQALLDYPATDINSQDYYGYTAFKLILQCCHDEALVQRLLDAGAIVTWDSLVFDLAYVSVALRISVLSAYARQQATNVAAVITALTAAGFGECRRRVVGV
jgi:hypothetical protein